MRTRRHPAARTRRGLALGTAVATAGLTGAYWIGDLGAATTTASSSSASSVSASTDDATSSSADDTFSFDDDVDISASAAAPDTSSRAS